MLLPVPHVRQRRQADCLVACAAMVLGYLLVPVDYDQVRRLLGTTEEGTPFSRLERLRSLGLFIGWGEGQLATLQTHLATGLPVIVDVRTWTLPHWRHRTDIAEVERDTDHALVVVGLDQSNVYLHDPDFSEAPLVTDHNAFLATWQERDHRYTVIGLAPGE